MPMIQHILDGSGESLLSSLAILDDFSKVSGLRLNDKKTEALWLVPVLEMIKFCYQEKNLNGQKTEKSKEGKIPRDVDFNRSRTICLLNYNEKLEKVKEILRCW